MLDMILNLVKIHFSPLEIKYNSSILQGLRITCNSTRHRTGALYSHLLLLFPEPKLSFLSPIFKKLLE